MRIRNIEKWKDICKEIRELFPMENFQPWHKQSGDILLDNYYGMRNVYWEIRLALNKEGVPMIIGGSHGDSYKYIITEDAVYDTYNVGTHSTLEEIKAHSETSAPLEMEGKGKQIVHSSVIELFNSFVSMYEQYYQAQLRSYSEVF